MQHKVAFLVILSQNVSRRSLESSKSVDFSLTVRDFLCDNAA
jgi:hypothetical protein